jgi:hypothetical protein
VGLGERKERRGVAQLGKEADVLISLVRAWAVWALSIRMLLGPFRTSLTLFLATIDFVVFKYDMIEFVIFKLETLRHDGARVCAPPPCEGRAAVV